MILQVCHRLSGGLASMLASLAGAVLIALTLMLLGDVVGRAFGQPLFGAQDVTEMAMALILFGAVPLLDHQSQQIRVDLLAGVMRGWPNRLAALIGALIAAAVWFGLAWALVKSAELSALLRLSTNILTLPKAPFQYALAGFAALAGLDAVLRFVCDGGQQDD